MCSVESAESYETPRMRGFFRKRDYLDRSSERSERGSGGRRGTGLGTRSGRSSSSIGSLRVGTGPRDRRSKYWDTGTLSPRSFFDTTAKKRGEKRGRAVEICRSEGERERGREGIEIEKEVTRARCCTRKAVLVLILLSQSSFSFLLPPLSLSLVSNYFEDKFPC